MRLNGTHTEFHRWVGLFYRRQPNWFESQTSKYEILSAEAVNDSAIFLTGTKNPDTDEYQLLQVFIVDRTDNSFEVSAWKGAERGLAAGFSVHVLATDSLTVVFGDTF